MPRPTIVGSLRAGDDAVMLDLDGVSEIDIAAGIYLDPECSPPHPIAGYRVYHRPADVDPQGPEPEWVPLTDVVPLGEPVTVTSPCPTAEGGAWSLAYGLAFDSNFTAYVSGPSTRYGCEPLLADPRQVDPGRQRPGNRERERLRDRFGRSVRN